MPILSVVVSAYNEEKRLARTLDSVSFADEIIVIDNSSIDKTSFVAKKYTKKVYTRPNYQMLNVNKNYGFTKATGDWILSLDADELVTKELEQEIKSKIDFNVHEIAGFWIPRKNIIFGKWIQHSIWWPDFQLRLFKNGDGKFPEKHVHEMLAVTGSTERLMQPMVHDNYTSISQYLYKLDKIYTESEVENFLKSGKKLLWIDAIHFPLRDFLKTFFFQKGYRDGLHGLVLSILQAFYAEVVFAKIWERQGFPEHNEKNFLDKIQIEMNKSWDQVRYWIYSSRIDETHNLSAKFFYRIIRKIFT